MSTRLDALSHPRSGRQKLLSFLFLLWLLGGCFNTANARVGDRTCEVMDMDEFIGTVKLFAFGFTPHDWMVCDGALINPRQYPALYSLVGNTYGGDGMNTFALPDLRGKEPIRGMHYCICANGTYPPRD